MVAAFLNFSPDHLKHINSQMIIKIELETS